MLKFLYVLSMLLSLLTTVLTEGILSRRTSPVEGKVNRIEENAIIFLIQCTPDISTLKVPNALCRYKRKSI